ncbi:hypothetical protein V502_09905 [Pseudogymnoascus sp. VKM F-4520 (FW-2644)]|nr:hypothetical protein V502_09905 [Pseudogymnoascus sp. VKM F-4520 (FW-2644)]
MNLARQNLLTCNMPLLSFHSLLPIFYDLCNGWTGPAALQLGVKMGEVSPEVNLVSEKGQNEIPRHEQRIGMAELAADKGLIVL